MQVPWCSYMPPCADKENEGAHIAIVFMTLLKMREPTLPYDVAIVF